MKKHRPVIGAALALLLVSCFGKDQSATPVTAKAIEKAMPEDKGTRINSFDLSEYKNEVTDKLDIWLTSRKESGDSLEIRYRLDFSKKGKIVKSFPVMLDYDDHGEWSAYGNAITGTTDEQRDSRFISTSFGYPACGYAQTEIKFFAADGDITIFNRNVGIADGVFYSGLEFEADFTGNKANTIYTKYVDIDESEASADTLVMLEIRYKDSVIYRYDGESWTPKAITKKGEVYRKQVISEDKYLKSIEE